MIIRRQSTNNTEDLNDIELTGCANSATGTYFGKFKGIFIVICAGIIAFTFEYTKVYADPAMGHSKTPDGVPNIDSRNFGPPYPFDSDELWSELLKVAAMDAISFKMENIESIFKVKFKRLDSNIANSLNTDYGMLAHINWYYDLHFLQDSSGSFFVFNWGQNPGSKYIPFPHSPKKICISQDKVEDDLPRMGWIINGRSGGKDIPYNNIYKLNRKVLSVSFDRTNNCLISFELQISRNKLQQ